MRKETMERNQDVARLRSIGLYTNAQIARALGIDASTVSHIYHERSRVPNNPVMSFKEVAQMENVNLEVIKGLTARKKIPGFFYPMHWHLKTVSQDPESNGGYGFGHDIDGNVISIGIMMCDAKGIGEEWISVEDAAEIAGMQRPRGMYNRVLKDQVKAIKAPEGKAFHIGDQKGLKILVKKNSIEPAQGKSKQKEPVQEVPLKAKQPEFAIAVKSDMGTRAPFVIRGRALDITVQLHHPKEGWVHEVLKLDIDLLPGDRPQVRTRTYSQ